MTRINCVPPAELTTKHLVAEYRELPRVVGLARRAFERGERHDDPRNPTQYTLGPGHVRFFYPRLFYLDRRFHQLVLECRRRGFKIQHERLPSHTDLPAEWLQDWEPDHQALETNRARINERLRK